MKFTKILKKKQNKKMINTNLSKTKNNKQKTHPHKDRGQKNQVEGLFILIAKKKAIIKVESRNLSKIILSYKKMKFQFKNNQKRKYNLILKKKNPQCTTRSKLLPMKSNFILRAQQDVKQQITQNIKSCKPSLKLKLRMVLSNKNIARNPLPKKLRKI